MSTPDPIDHRTLNRTLLLRQHLMARQPVSAYDTIEHLVGMQAQLPLDPYVGLWSRLAGFDVDELSRLLLNRQVVRIVVMRGTIHLVSADDALTFWPLTRVVLERAYRSGLGKPVRGVDLEPVLEFGRTLLTERPRTRTETRAALAERWPDLDANALAWGISYLLPLVQVTPRGVWGERMQPTLTTVESWLDRPLDPEPSIDQVVSRYLAAFGPATVKDIQSWCGLTRLREVVDRLGAKLRVFRSDEGAVLYDVPDAPLSGPDVEAPVRFLPVYDNALIGHADRSRITGDHPGRYPLFSGPDRDYGTVLVDGFLAAAWKVDAAKGDAVLTVRPLEKLSKRHRSAVADEAAQLLEFMAADADSYDVRFVPAE